MKALDQMCLSRTALEKACKQKTSETCAECHLKVTSRTSISKEMFPEDEDILEGISNPAVSIPGKHTCIACHTNQIGSTPPPCSHYLLLGDKYFSVEDFPRVPARLLSGVRNERTPERATRE